MSVAADIESTGRGLLKHLEWASYASERAQAVVMESIHTAEHEIRR